MATKRFDQLTPNTVLGATDIFAKEIDPTGSKVLQYISTTALFGWISAASPISFTAATGALSIQKADASHNGYLSSTDWTTFNSKQAALSLGNLTELTSAVLTIGGGTGAVVGPGATITVTKADSIHSGYLSSTDWGTFNSKQNAITPAALTKTDDTNVTLTLGGSSTVALLAAASLTLGWTGQLGLTRGGTAASLTASNGGIVYSTASALAILAGTATANKVLMSGASTTPSWSVPTFPNASATLGKLIISDGTNWIASTPTWPNAIALGDTLYGSAASTVTPLSGNITTTRKFLTQTGTGAVSAAPGWFDLFNTANTFSIAQTVEIDGITSTATDGLILLNNTLSTSSVTTQAPPLIRLSGHVWKFASNIDQTTDWVIRNQPSPSGANPGYRMLFMHAVTPGSYANVLELATGGSTAFGNRVNYIGGAGYYAINNVSVLSETTLGTAVVNSSLTSVGTLTGGIWNATVIALAYGGTGANLTAPGASSLLGYDTTDASSAFIAIGSGLTYTHATHTLSASGGGGSPAGSNYQLQFYSGGSFGADAALNWDNTNKQLILATTGVSSNGLLLDATYNTANMSCDPDGNLIFYSSGTQTSFIRGAGNSLPGTWDVKYNSIDVHDDGNTPLGSTGYFVIYVDDNPCHVLYQNDS